MKTLAAISIILAALLLPACGSETQSPVQTIPEASPQTETSPDTTGETSRNETERNETDTAEAETTPEEKKEVSEAGKVLVVYFSATNTTKGIARLLAEGLEADLYEIIPAVPYTQEDLNYSDNNSRTSVEMNDPSARPEISGTVEHMEQYQIIYLGYPIWWGEAPRIISTFVESYDFSGKTIIPFCTSGSSGIGSSAQNLEMLTEGAQWMEGHRFSGSASQDELMEWAENIN